MQKTREALTFLDPEDERTLFERLAAAAPGVVLVDGSRWPRPDPPVRRSISDCAQGIVYLWDPAICAALPYRERGGGFDGPASGIVIQWVRSRVVDGSLLSGRLAAGYEGDDAAMSAFVTTVWKVLREVTTDDVVRIDGMPDSSYRIGASARAEARAASYALRHSAVEVYYVVS